MKTEDKKINAKRIMGMMRLGLSVGEEITVIAEGKDEEDAVNHIEQYVSAN